MQGYVGISSLTEHKFEYQVERGFYRGVLAIND